MIRLSLYNVLFVKLLRIWVVLAIPVGGQVGGFDAGQMALALAGTTVDFAKDAEEKSKAARQRAELVEPRPRPS